MHYIRDHVNANPDARLTEPLIRHFHRILTEGMTTSATYQGAIAATL